MGYLPDLVMMGMQGCGKGTVAAKLSEKYGYLIFEMSSRLTEEKEKNPEFRKKIETTMAQGRLVGPGIILGIVDRFIAKVDEYTPILWDGVPRTANQLKKLKSFLSKHDRKPPVCMHLVVSAEVARQRMAGRGRADDIDEKARENRINFFLSETQPAIDAYEKVMGLPVLRVNGEQSPQEVLHEAIELLEAFVEEHPEYRLST
jgi:adenylate kinase